MADNSDPEEEEDERVRAAREGAEFLKDPVVRELFFGPSTVLQQLFLRSSRLEQLTIDKESKARPDDQKTQQTSQQQELQQQQASDRQESVANLPQIASEPTQSKEEGAKEAEPRGPRRIVWKEPETYMAIPHTSDHYQSDAEIRLYLLAHPFESSPATGNVILDSDDTWFPFYRYAKRKGGVIFSRRTSTHPPPTRDETFLKAEALKLELVFPAPNQWPTTEVQFLATKGFLPHVPRRIQKKLAHIRCQCCRARLDLVFEHLFVLYEDIPSRHPTSFSLRNEAKFVAWCLFRDDRANLSVWASPCQGEGL